jgi:hypothetical protein
MAEIDPPKPNPLIKWMAKLIREKAPGIAEAAGKVAEYPPVKLAGNLMNAADPMGVMGIAAPLQVFDAWGNAIKVSAETGKPLAKTAKDITQATAQAEMAAQLARKAEANAGGPFRSVGFRNRNTGEVIEGGLTHPSSSNLIPESWTPGMGLTEEGFITRDGRFLTREEARNLTGIGDRYGGTQMEAEEAWANGAFGKRLSGKEFDKAFQDEMSRYGIREETWHPTRKE